MSRLRCGLSESLAIGFFVVTLFTSPAPAQIVADGSFEDIGSATSSFSIDNPTVLPDWTDNAGSYMGPALFDCLVVPGASTMCGTSGSTANGHFWVSPGPRRREFRGD